MRELGAILVLIIAAAMVVLIVWGTGKQIVDKETHDQAIRNTAAFGKQHDLDLKFVLHRGSSVRIRSEVGDLLICLPNEGKPTILVAPEENNVPQTDKSP